MSFLVDMRTLATTTLVLALLFVLQGCDAIERTEPSLSISQETALSSPAAVRGVRANMFSRFHSTALSTNWMLGPSSLADNTYFRGGATRHRGFNLNELGAHIGTGAYGIMYDTINDANLLISGIDEGAVSEAEASKLQAEAFFIRALIFHHAARIFGYEPGMTPPRGPGQNNDLGIELRLEPTVSLEQATPLARSTAQEVYDQIVSDLNTAIEGFASLPADQVEGSPFFPSEAAAQALLARVQLYQQNYSAADQAAQEAIDLAGASFGSRLAGPSEVRDIFDETAANPEAIFTIDVDPQTETAGVNNSLSAYMNQQWMAQMPTQDLLDLYSEEDARQSWYAPCFDDVAGTEVDCSDVNERSLELQKYNAEQGNFADDYIHFRISEMVLIQAEARLNTGGVGTAIDRLNDLRVQRNATELDPADFNAESALDEILAERRRELVAEGHRYFDLKRLGRDIAKSQGKLATPPVQEFVPYEDVRVLDDFPSTQIEINELLEQNPGYDD